MKLFNNNIRDTSPQKYAITFTAWTSAALLNVRDIYTIHVHIYICICLYEQRLLNQTEINRKMVETIWFRFDLIRFRKDFSVEKDVLSDRSSRPPAHFQRNTFVKNEKSFCIEDYSTIARLRVISITIVAFLWTFVDRWKTRSFEEEKKTMASPDKDDRLHW